MKYLIAIPCMDMVHTMFMLSVVSMHKPGNCMTAVSRSSLVYDSRNKLADMAVKDGYDRILWLDSDMHFSPNTMQRLDEDLDAGRDFVTALAYTRKTPVKPCIYSGLIEKDGTTEAVTYENVPKSGIFEIAACGFGCVMMNVDVFSKVGQYGPPFAPLPGWGEDLSFCVRAANAGITLWCDSGIRVGHIGQALVDGTGQVEML